MADRGIDVVRAHLANLPPSDSLTVAERRAQFSDRRTLWRVDLRRHVFDVKARHGIGEPHLPRLGIIRAHAQTS